MNNTAGFREILKKLYALLDRKQKRNFILILLIMIVSSALTQFTPKAIGWLTDDILAQSTIRFLQVIPALILILIVTIVNELIKIFRRLLVEDTATKTEKKSRNLAITALLKAPLSGRNHQSGKTAFYGFRTCDFQQHCRDYCDLSDASRRTGSSDASCHSYRDWNCHAADQHTKRHPY